ncbi:MAG: OB-fold nucleic acid binding domain-containing protein, partial [Candidatus Binatia bacterium]
MDSLKDWQRSCYCGEPRPAQVGRELTVMGWVHAQRDHGGVTFLDLRDRSGVVQVVCNPQTSPAAHTAAKDVRLEYVLAVRGTLARRSPETVNPNLPTGEVEIVATEVQVLNASCTTPFPVDDTVI